LLSDICPAWRLTSGKRQVVDVGYCNEGRDGGNIGRVVGIRICYSSRRKDAFTVGWLHKGRRQCQQGRAWRGRTACGRLRHLEPCGRGQTAHARYCAMPLAELLPQVLLGWIWCSGSCAADLRMAGKDYEEKLSKRPLFQVAAMMSEGRANAAHSKRSQTLDKSPWRAVGWRCQVSQNAPLVFCRRMHSHLVGRMTLDESQSPISPVERIRF
jgi:hypothetical protein